MTEKVNPIRNMSNMELLMEYDYRHSIFDDYCWRNDNIVWTKEKEDKAWEDYCEAKNEVLRRMGEDV